MLLYIPRFIISRSWELGLEHFSHCTMYIVSELLAVACLTTLAISAQCPDYSTYSSTNHPPFSNGKYKMSYQRPAIECRTFPSPVVEATVARFKSIILDPDLSRLFENSYPNSLDTAIRWKGYAANNSDEELTFVITGDMWVRRPLARTG